MYGMYSAVLAKGNELEAMSTHCQKLHNTIFAHSQPKKNCTAQQEKVQSYNCPYSMSDNI